MAQIPYDSMIYIDLKMLTLLCDFAFSGKESNPHHTHFMHFESIPYNVGKTIINHPPVITIFIGGRNHSQMGGL
jgi:hypothetical protein